MSDTQCEVCKRTVLESETVRYKGATVCKDCMRSFSSGVRITNLTAIGLAVGLPPFP